MMKKAKTIVTVGTLIFSTTFFSNLVVETAYAATILPLTSVVKIIAGNSQSGSGFVIDTANKYILTNAHVVLAEDTYKPFNAYIICTITSQSDDVLCGFSATLLYADVDKDLAILQVNVYNRLGKPRFDQPAISITEAKNPAIGEKMNVLGFPPLGGNTITASQGIVSGFKKDENGTISFIKTDSNLISGTSGGVAVDENGIFLGIPSSYLSNYDDEKIGIVIAGVEVKKWFYSINEKILATDFSAPYITTISPGKIMSITLKKRSATSVEVTWNPPIHTIAIDRYALIYDIKELFNDSIVNIKDQPNYIETPNNETSFVVKNLDSKKTYYFSVIAHDVEKNLPTAWADQATIDMTTGQVGDRLFSDVATDHENLYALKYLKEKGIVFGYPDGTFRPKSSIKRAELMKLVVLGKEGYMSPEDYNNCFSDVSNEWFAPYVCYAKEKTWIKGYSDNTFKPNQDVTRGEALKIIENIYELPALQAPTNGLPSSLKGQWFSPYLAFAAEAGILSEAVPKVPVHKVTSRAETAEMLYRAILVSYYDDAYSSEMWKDAAGKDSDPAEYFGLDNVLTKKFKVTRGEKVTYTEEFFRRGCKKSKGTHCYTHFVTETDRLGNKESVSEKEIRADKNALFLLRGSSTIWTEPVDFPSPSLLFPKKNTVFYNRSLKPIRSKVASGGAEGLLFDGIDEFEFLGHEKIKLASGEYNALKIKNSGFFFAESRVPDESIIKVNLFYESTAYYVRGFGLVKKSESMQVENSSGDILNTIKTETELVEMR